MKSSRPSTFAGLPSIQQGSLALILLILGAGTITIRAGDSDAVIGSGGYAIPIQRIIIPCDIPKTIDLGWADVDEVYDSLGETPKGYYVWVVKNHTPWIAMVPSVDEWGHSTIDLEHSTYDPVRSNKTIRITSPVQLKPGA